MAGNVKQSSLISFVKELDYSSMSIPRKHPRNERETSAEELGTITLEIKLIRKSHSLISSFLVDIQFKQAL